MDPSPWTDVRRWVQPTSVGELVIETSALGVCSVGLAGAHPEGVASPDPDVAAAFVLYDSGEMGALEKLVVDFGADATPFQVSVWAELRQIPAGETVSYGELAERVGRPRSASRAVGRAVGANPIPVIVPCHRVVAADGTLGGFALGLDMKRRLLAHEGVEVPTGGWEPAVLRV